MLRQMKLLVSYLSAILLQPNLEQTVLAKQANQEDNRDKHAKPRELLIGETVVANNPSQAFRL